jgi:hypothetical protein
MKLKIVPPRTGIQWVKWRLTFFRQPLALSGLFFMFLAVMSVAAGARRRPVLASGLLPACTLGLMAASREALNGKFPDAHGVPERLSGRFGSKLRAMLVLGALYGVGFWRRDGRVGPVRRRASPWPAGKMPTGNGPVTPSSCRPPCWPSRWVMQPCTAGVTDVLACAGARALARCRRSRACFSACGLPAQPGRVHPLRLVLDGRHDVCHGAGGSLVALLLGSPEFAGLGMLPAMLLVMQPCSSPRSISRSGLFQRRAA